MIHQLYVLNDAGRYYSEIDPEIYVTAIAKAKFFEDILAAQRVAESESQTGPKPKIVELKIAERVL